MFLIFILVGIIPLLLIKNGILKSYEEQAVRQRASIIQNQSDLITAQIAKTGYLEGEESTLADVEMQQMANLYSGRILIVNKEFCIVKDTYGLD